MLLLIFVKDTTNKLKPDNRLRFLASKANLLEAFIVKLAREQKILMDKGTNNPNADMTIYIRQPTRSYKV